MTTTDRTTLQTLVRSGSRARREAIIDAARHVFLRDGFDAASVDDIAERAGVSKQTIYNYGCDKDYLFVQVVQQMTERCGSLMVEAVESVPFNLANLEEELNQIAAGICERFLDPEGNAFRPLVMVEARKNPEYAREWDERGQGRVIRTLRDRLARLAEAGRLTVADPLVAARQFFALTTYEADRISMLSLESFDRAELERSQRAGVRMFLTTYAADA